VPVQSQMDSIDNLTLCFFKLHFNIILAFKPSYLQNSVCISQFFHYVLEYGAEENIWT
jgi:hypothetical protein